MMRWQIRSTTRLYVAMPQRLVCPAIFLPWADTKPRRVETTTECGVFSKMNVLKITMVASALALGGMSSVAEAKSLQNGAASWYGPGFQGRKTASGERFNTHAMTAA